MSGEDASIDRVGQANRDGTVSDIEDVPAGYTIVSADSMKEAIAMAADCPILEGYHGSIQVCETFEAV